MSATVPRVLITRPREDAAALAAALEARGYQVAVEPMLIVEPTGAAPDLDGAQAVLATSANGVRALARASRRRDIALFAVGDATARAAAEAGFATVESAGRDAAALAALAADRLDPARGRLVHVAGDAVAGDLAGDLATRGFEATRVALYRARAATAISEAGRRMIAGGEIDAVLFFSPRTAQTFVRLASDAGLGPSCAAMAAICLSAAVAKAAEGCAWRSVRIAERPDREALIEALDGWNQEHVAGTE